MPVIRKMYGPLSLWAACVGLLLFLIEVPLSAQQNLMSCKPLDQRTGETGCWILARQPVAALEGQVYWTLDALPTKELAEQAKRAERNHRGIAGQVLAHDFG